MGMVGGLTCRRLRRPPANSSRVSLSKERKGEGAKGLIWGSSRPTTLLNPPSVSIPEINTGSKHNGFCVIARKRGIRIWMPRKIGSKWSGRSPLGSPPPTFPPVGGGLVWEARGEGRVARIRPLPLPFGQPPLLSIPEINTGKKMK